MYSVEDFLDAEVDFSEQPLELSGFGDATQTDPITQLPAVLMVAPPGPVMLLEVGVALDKAALLERMGAAYTTCHSILLERQQWQPEGSQLDPTLLPGAMNLSAKATMRPMAIQTFNGGKVVHGEWRRRRRQQLYGVAPPPGTVELLLRFTDSTSLRVEMDSGALLGSLFAHIDRHRASAPGKLLVGVAGRWWLRE